MTKCFYVSSCIETDDSAPLTYAPRRSVFSANERYRQTIITVNTLKCLSPNAHIYVVDASEQYHDYYNLFPLLFSNCTFVPVKEISSPADYDTIRRHPNKSLGESLILRNFVYTYEQELRRYDYCFKMSGRYVLTNTYQDTMFDGTNTHRIFFKAPLIFPWDEKWAYLKTDLRQEESHNDFRQYCSVFYGYGKKHLSSFMNLYAGMVGLLQHPSMLGYDVETLLYYLMADYRSSITTLPVDVMGWEGPSGDLMKY